MSVTRTLADFVATRRTMPQSVKAAAGELILDSVGCGLAAVSTDLGLIVQRFVGAAGTGRETVLGTTVKASPALAAYANARLINIIDQDETYMVLGHHANAALGAALALAERTSVDGAKLVEAFAIGFEVGARAGNYMGSPLIVGEDGKVGGWHFPGPILGVYAACAAASVCLGLSAPQVENAFGICGQYMPVNGGELWEAGRRVVSLPTVKYEDCGVNAQAGLMAALMAQEGMTGTLGVFDPANHLAGIARPGAIADPDALVARLGEDWRLTRTSFKPWPSCRWFHYVLTALHFALRNNPVKASEVDRVQLWSSSAACFFSDPEIGTNIVMDASFSLPHSAAMMLLGIPPGPAWFDPALVHREDVAALRRKVSVSLEPSVQDPAAWGNVAAWGKVDGQMKVPSRAAIHVGGQIFEASSDFALGDCWSDRHRFTSDDVTEKFKTLAGSVAPQSGAWREHVGELAQRFRRLDEVESVADLLAELSPLSFAAKVG